ncbi:hypothetical protein ACP3WZ_26075, partial [Salmonella enterica]|uniref:hypothetical protein n=1 Tax=Salmonella enterica TaxID=28901 RepID=UPI003CEC94CD
MPGFDGIVGRPVEIAHKEKPGGPKGLPGLFFCQWRERLRDRGQIDRCHLAATIDFEFELE